MAAHVCPECQLLHDAVTPQESEAVTLARIAKEQAVEVAKIQARQERDWNETRVEVAAIEGEAEVGAAAAEAEVIAAVLTADDTPAEEPAPDPIVIDAPAVEEEIAEDAPPENDAPAPTVPGKGRGLGMW
jgi:hypothetical protein